MTTLGKLKQLANELNNSELLSLVIELEKENASLGVVKYDDNFFYMPLAILGLEKRFLVFTQEEIPTIEKGDWKHLDCHWTYSDMLEGITQEQKIGEFVEKRRKELNLC